MTVHNITNLTFLGFLSENISVIGTIFGSLITGVISYLIQSNNNKSKLKESKQQFLFKITEQDLKEKRELIKPLLQFFESIVSPASISFPADVDEFNTSLVLQSNIIKNEISTFLINYSIFINEKIKGNIWQLHESILLLEQWKERIYTPELEDYTNAYQVAIRASKSVEIINDNINILVASLYEEISIDKS